MHFARFLRLRLAHLPTPFEPMERLSAALGGPEIWIKRDDCTGLSTGGNKTRKLEFLMAEAQAEGADLVMTQGATQLNHARQTAAFAARLGMDCHILLEDRTGSRDPNYNQNGNVFLDLLHGATTETRPGGLDMNAELVPDILKGFAFIPLKEQAGDKWLGSAPATMKATAEFLKSAGRIDTVAEDYSGFVNAEVAKKVGM